MTREIKFRYWDTKRNQMVEWESIKTFCRFGAVERMKHQIFQQYTGLQEKTGRKEIFEGDIVEFNNCDYQRTGGYMDDEIVRGKVTFACGGWMIETKNGNYDLYSALMNDEELEVIGNIYEHPYLLEKQHG